MPDWPVRSRTKAQELLGRVSFVDDGVADVGPVEAGDEAGRVGEAQAGAHVVAGLRVGGGRAGDDGHVGKQLAQPTEVDVLGAKVVAPLRDAVRFVDGEEGDAGGGRGGRGGRPARRPARRGAHRVARHAAVAEPPQALQKAVGHETFGRYVEQVELAAVQARQHAARLV